MTLVESTNFRPSLKPTNNEGNRNTGSRIIVWLEGSMIITIVSYAVCRQFLNHAGGPRHSV